MQAVSSMLEHLSVLSSSLLLGRIPLYAMELTPYLFVHLSVDGHLGCFHFGAILNNAGINIHVQVFVRTYVFISLEKIAESYGNFMFNILKNCQTVFQCDCIILRSRQRCSKAPISAQPCQH